MQYSIKKCFHIVFHNFLLLFEHGLKNYDQGANANGVMELVHSFVTFPICKSRISRARRGAEVYIWNKASLCFPNSSLFWYPLYICAINVCKFWFKLLVVNQSSSCVCPSAFFLSHSLLTFAIKASSSISNPHLEPNYTSHGKIPNWNMFCCSFLTKTKRIWPFSGHLQGKFLLGALHFALRYFDFKKNPKIEP